MADEVFADKLLSRAAERSPYSERETRNRPGTVFRASSGKQGVSLRASGAHHR
jgi:hypothetical protein